MALQGGVEWISGGLMAAAAAMCCSHTAMAQGIRAAAAVAAAAAAPTAGGRKEGREGRERAREGTEGGGGEEGKGKETEVGGRHSAQEANPLAAAEQAGLGPRCRCNSRRLPDRPPGWPGGQEATGWARGGRARLSTPTRQGGLAEPAPPSAPRPATLRPACTCWLRGPAAWTLGRWGLRGRACCITQACARQGGREGSEEQDWAGGSLASGSGGGRWRWSLRAGRGLAGEGTCRGGGSRRQNAREATLPRGERKSRGWRQDPGLRPEKTRRH